MNPTDELSILIKGMDKNEKGYFRKFSKLHGSKEGNYLKLFDSIASMEDCSDMALRDRFKGEKFVARLSATKFYLKKMIIRALRNYHEERLPKLQNILSMADTQVMIYKQMNESLPDRFEKEINKALVHEKFAEYLFWSTLYQPWLSMYAYSPEFIHDREKLLLGMREAINKLQNLNEYFIMDAEASTLHAMAGIDPPPSVLKRMRDLLDQPLLAMSDAAISVRAKEQRISILTPLYQRTGQRDKALDLLREEIATTSKDYNGITPSPHNYLVTIHRLLNAFRKKNVEEMLMMLKKYEGILQAYKHVIPSTNFWNLEIIQLMHQCRYCLYKRQPLKVLPLTVKLKGKLKGKAQSFPHHYIFSLIMEAYALLELRRWDEALEIVNKVYDTNYEIRSDLAMTAEWLRVIIHIELGNFILVESLISQATRHSKKLKSNLTYEKELYRYFRLMAEKMNQGVKKDMRFTAREFLQYIESNVPDELDYIKNWLSDKL